MCNFTAYLYIFNKYNKLSKIIDDENESLNKYFLFANYIYNQTKYIKHIPYKIKFERIKCTQI